MYVRATGGGAPKAKVGQVGARPVADVYLLRVPNGKVMWC